MVRILHCADLHLEISFARLGLPAGIGSNLRSELRSTLGSILSEARRLQVDAVTIAGDLYEQATALPETARFLIQQFERMGSTPVLIAPGKQDPYGANSLYALTRWPSNVHMFSSPDFEPLTLASTITVWGAACPTAAQEAWRQQITRQPNSTNVMLAHAVIAPETDPSIFTVSESALPAANVAVALLGGSHQPQIPHPSGRIVFPGSPQPLDWSDPSTPRGAVLVSIQDGRFTAEQIQLRSWRFADLAVRLEQCHTAEDVAKRVEREFANLNTQGSLTVVAQVTLYGASDGDFTLAEVRAALVPEVNVVLNRPFAFPYDLDQLSQEQTVRGTLVRRVREQLDASSDATARTDLLAALKTALLAVEGRQVHPDAIG